MSAVQIEIQIKRPDDEVVTVSVDADGFASSSDEQGEAKITHAEQAWIALAADLIDAEEEQEADDAESEDETDDEDDEEKADE